MTYGRAFDSADHYHKAPAGWWCCLTGAAPADLLRVNAIPGYMVERWMVPQILRPDGLGTAAVGYWMADGFRVPDALEPVVDGLRALLDYTGPIEAPHAQLAADILAVNYHVTMVELGLMAVLTNAMTRSVLIAAAGIPPVSPVANGGGDG